MRLRNNPKAREMAKAETRIETKTKGSEDNTVSFMERIRGTSPRIVQMPRRPKKRSKVEQIHSLHHNHPEER